MSKTLNLNELQGNILRGYRADLTHVRYLLLEVVDLSDARRFLAASIEGVTIPGKIIFELIMSVPMLGMLSRQ